MSDYSDKAVYKLFIDELGHANYKHPSPFYVLSCCSVDDLNRVKMQVVADRIKFKYWGRTDVIFHSREIGRRSGDFAIFKDKDLFAEFLYDLQNFIFESQFKMFFAIVDKSKAQYLGWDEIKIYKETSAAMIKNFLLILLSNDSRGEIIIESATAEKDFYFHRALGYFLSSGLKRPKVNYAKVQETVTSISFVSKKNHDIEEQLADLFAYALKCKQLKIKPPKGSYEEMILDALSKKTFRIPRGAKPPKKKFLNEVEAIKLLP